MEKKGVPAKKVAAPKEGHSIHPTVKKVATETSTVAPPPNPRVERAQQQTVPPLADAQPQLPIDPVFFAQVETLLRQLPLSVDPAEALASLKADLFGHKQPQTLAQPMSSQPEVEAESPLNVEDAGTQPIVDVTDSSSEVEVGAQGLGGLLASYSSSDESEREEAEEEVEKAITEKEQGQDSRPIVEEEGHDSGPIVEEEGHDSGPIVDEQGQGLEPHVSDKEPAAEMEKEENDPPIMREDIEVVEIEDDVDDEVDQPTPSGRQQQEHEEDWAILRTLEEEPIVDDNGTALRMRQRIVHRALFDEPDTT